MATNGSYATLSSTATTIATASSALSSLLSTNNIPEPTLSPTSPHTLPSTDPIRALTNTLLDAAEDLKLLLNQRSQAIPRYNSDSVVETSTINAAVRLGVFEALPDDNSTISTHSLAAAVGIAASSIWRFEKLLAVLRLLRFVEEPECGEFRHGFYSRQFRGMQTSVEWIWGYLQPAGNALGTWMKETPEEGGARDPFTVVNGTPLFELLEQRPEISKLLAGTMKTYGPHIRQMNALADYFQQHPATGSRTLIIDVGGGNGHVSRALAASNPGYQFLVQDNDRSTFASYEAAADNTLPVSYEKHNFFLPQPPRPVGTVKAYFIRQCLHNWTDAEAVGILKGFVGVMEQDPEIVLVVNDDVMPAPGTTARRAELESALFDVSMMVLTDGQSRRREGYEKILKEADGRFEVVSCVEDDPPVCGLLVVKLASE